MNCVELQKVRKTYDEFVAVDDLSLSIPAGGIFGLLGPNGAGKTSTIRMMLGITIPDAGEILAAPAASPNREKAVLECARKRMRFRSQMLGFCIGYGLMPFAFVFDHGHLTWIMVRDNPKAAVVFWIASAACGVGAWWVGRRQTAGA